MLASQDPGTAQQPEVPVFNKLSNNTHIPTVGYGTWQIKERDECIMCVTKAVNVGYRLIDTATVYKNETFIREAVLELKNQSEINNKRYRYRDSNEDYEADSIFVTSKASPHQLGLDETYNAALVSIQNLGCKALDLYLLHWPGKANVPPSSPENREGRRMAWMACERLYREGHARAIGVSNFSATHLTQLERDGLRVHPMVNQIEHHPFYTDLDLPAHAQAHFTRLQAYASLGGGSGVSELMANPAVKLVAEETGRTEAQVLLRWAMQQGYMVLPRSRCPSRIASNFCLFDFSLSHQHVGLLNALTPTDSEKMKKFCWDPKPVV
eukprot:GHVN01071946.1.p1 GENE.GHVN01071946.1~~GHVN01071946.1.p1  ORF type:complete len:325 (-),score=57.20 GHVN01071946.1:710-1684(-)